MGRKTDVLLKGFRAAKCLTLLKVATARIKVARNKRSNSAKQMRGEIAQLIKSGQDAHVYITKADALFKQENMVAVYDLLDQYCHAIMSRFPAIEMQRNCPVDMKVPIASIIYAAPRCVELTELPAIKDAFVAKYGKEFAAAASELRPDCGVNTQIIELLSTRPATGDMKLKLMKEICKEHNVDWTPGEALAGPPVATGLAEAKVEPMQATGTLGSIKANTVYVGVGEAGPSNTAPLQVASKDGTSNKIGLAEAMVSAKAGGDILFATNASKTSDQKQSSSSEGDVAKGKASFSESFKGVLSTAPSTKDSSKAAVLAAKVSKNDDTKLSAFEEEDARRLHARILQSLKGGSFVDSEAEAGTNAEDFVKPMDAQVGMSDSDSDSFVSVEDGRFEDDVEPSSHGAASRKDSFRDNPNQGFTEADLKNPSLIKKLSTSSQQDIYSRESSKNSGGAMEIHEGMPASSNFSSLPMESSHEDISFKVNSKKTLNAEEVLEKERRQDSLNRGKHVEAHSVERLKENMMINESKDNFSKVSSKKSSNAEEMMEEEIRKDRLSMGKLVEAQSVEELNEDRKISEKVAEELSVETNDKEGLQRKDSLEDKSAEATTESSVKWKLSERYSFESRNTDERLGDESCLHGEGIIKVMPSVETTEIKLVRNRVEECSLEANEVEFVAEGKSRLPASGIFKDQSGSERKFDEEMSEAVGEEACMSNEELPERVCDDESRVFGEEPFPSFQKALETGGGESGSLPAVGKSVEELVGASPSSALAILENSQDFAAAAKVIAAEAARLAVLDYAKRLAESNSIPIDLGELSKLGLAFEESKGGPQVKKTSRSEGKSDGEGLGYAGDRKSYETAAIKEEKIFKAETTLNHDKVHSSYYLDSDEMSANNEKSKPSVADDALEGESGNLNASITTEKKPKLQETEIEDTNPFATSVSTNTDKDTNSPPSKIDDEEVSWLDMTQTGKTNKVENFGRDDHLDIFFRRKTLWMSEENPLFDEDRYSYPKLKPSFMEGRMPYDGSDTKKSSLQSTVFKESSDSLKSPVFDEGNGGSFKSPVFDEGPEPYDAAFSSDDGLNKSNVCSAVTDQRGHQSPTGIKSPASFDPEPEHCFDKVADEEELSSKERKESPPEGKLKWQTKKPINSVEHVVTGNQSGLNASDTSLGVSGNPMSRRSRQPKVSDDGKHHGGSPSQLTSRSSLSQQQDNEPDRKDEDNVGEKKTLGRKQVRPYVSSSSAMSQQPSDSPKWGTSQADYDSPLEDQWDSPSTKISSPRTTKSPTRLDNRQRVRPEDFYFPEKEDLARRPVGTSMSRKTNKSPTRMTGQQPMTHGYVGVEEDCVGTEDDPAGYKISYTISRIPKVYQHDTVEDDGTEELQGKYKPSLQTSELSKRTPAGSGFDSQQQQRHQQQKPGMRSEYKHYREDGGESSRTRPVSSRQQKKYMEEEEPYLVSRYKPRIQDDEPLDYGSSSKSRTPNLSQLEKDVDEDYEQQRRRQEQPGMGPKDVRPMSSRQQQKKYIEEEEPYLGSRYKPTMQDDDEPLDYGSSNKLRVSKSNQLEKDVYEDNEKMGKQYGEDVGESLRTRPMSSRLQPKKYIEEESSNLLSRYTTRLQDGEPLDYQSSNKSRIPIAYRPEKDVGVGHEGLQAGDRHQTETDDSGERTSTSSGVNRWYQQRRQQEEDAVESEYVQYEVTAGRDRSRLSAGRKPSDFEEAQDLAPGYKPLMQSDNRVKSSPPRPLSRRQLEKKRIEEVESALRYNRPIATDDHLLGRQAEEEEQFIPRTSSQQNQGPQQKQNWPTPSDGCESDSQSNRQNPGSQQQEQIQKDKQQLVSGRWQKQGMAEEEVVEDGEKQRLPSPSYKNNQKDKKDLQSFDEPCEPQQEKQRYKSTSSLKGQQEQVGQISKSSWSPLYSRNQDSRLMGNLSKSGQQELEQKVGQEEGINEQQEKTLTETELLSRRHQHRTEEGGASGKQDKSGTKSKLLTQQPSTSLPLESSISDPIVLATIPPPVKKPSLSPTVKLESSGSAPSPSNEVKVPKLPLKPPNLEDLAANFEALRRARKGD